MPILKQSKYEDIFKMHRIHSTCNTYTTTGRINMHTPNLQFIPKEFNVNLGEFNDENEEIDSEISMYRIDDEIALRDLFIAAEGK